ncbi:restriction endonuclease subunit S [Azospirillum brasilense]|uniref:Restriction endonuclease subunit S n=1 Tax=Azospirillum brasilense TaxID=192 RepID=A0ABU4P5R9_AZOBR|nr:hypothetical protein [Azospirillum brasilense]MDW7552748.1 hypothetical protein [Azospirillum brasilense]MDW7592060.1 hypothetical protein [Azospirillum brasilense]MDW7627663.1 hypothetical protein [Azospirillum brasilense]MDX5952868.1 hypothetical protein [Azospirillum brasilense]
MTTRIGSLGLTPNRLDPTYYRPEHLRDCELRALWARESLDELRASSAPIVYGVLKPDDRGAKFRVAKAERFDGMFVSAADCDPVSEELFREFGRAEAVDGDLLVAIGGYVGRPAMLRLEDGLRVVVNRHLARVRIDTGRVDSGWVLAYFSSPLGERQLAREITGSVQAGINLCDLRLVEVPLPASEAQRYIGDKVRQAGRLRARARTMRHRLNTLLNLPHVTDALRTADRRANRVPSANLNNRLDAKYYGRRAMNVLESVSRSSVELGSLVENVSNGFEHRNFSDLGTPYITVAEVSGGRLALTTAPRLGPNVPIPEKAKIDTRCVLVVRTGSIGVAVPVFEDDTCAAISSHLIRLRYKSEQEAAVVAAFLNSDAGRVLLQKISYGAVQPQIGQDELLSLPLPRALIEQSSAIHVALKAEDACLRAVERLVSSAKLLVEYLIDGRLSEADLIAAQKGLEAGKRDADRAVLQSLRQGDGADAPPLIPDLDGLYALLDEPDEGSGP